MTKYDLEYKGSNLHCRKVRNVIAETFIKNFFQNGHNLFAIVWEDTDCFRVQLGHFSTKYKRKETALKMYKEYLEKAKAHRTTKEKKMYEVVDEKDLKRFAVITFEDTIFWDSDDVLECQRIFKTWEVYRNLRTYIRTSRRRTDRGRMSLYCRRCGMLV